MFLLTSGSLAGQACTGNDVPDGRWSAAAQMLGEGSGRAWGVETRANPEGPWSVGAEVNRWSLDREPPGAWGFQASGNFEVRSGHVSVCPGVGLGYLDLASPSEGPAVSASVTSLPFRLDVGTTLALGRGFRLTPHGAMEFGVDWTRARAIIPEVGMVSITESSTGVAFQAGAALGYDRYQLGARAGSSRNEGVGRSWAAILRIAL